MSNSTQLRDYQEEMLRRLESAWGHERSVMVQMPTGTGKTHLMAAVIRRYLAHGAGPAGGVGEGRVLIVAHRRELLEQIRRTLTAFGLPAGEVAVESIQKLSRHIGTTTLQPTLVVVDEAHHAQARTYRQLWERWPQARFLGLTATPCRLDHAGFLELFPTLLQSHSIREFIRRGWLSDFDYVTAEPDNPILLQVAGLTKRGADGDYQTREMALVMDCEASIAHLYRAYRTFADHQRGIVYAIGRDHARHIADYYASHGVRCCWIEARTPAAERDRIVRSYRAGEVDVVVNVDILGEGVDFPDVEFIQLARPTLSLGKYLQQVGRGMRVAAGKAKVVILDHVGMYASFGLPTADRDWASLFAGRVAGKAGVASGGLLYVDVDTRERELVNLKMVRIKRADAEHHGLEVYMQGGLYGIALDGEVLHPASFAHVRRADDGYFAYCTYPYLVYHSRVTIIDSEGRDLRLKMYGSLEWDDDVLVGHDIGGGALYWDRRYGTYYDEKPAFETLGGVEMVRLQAGYVLRQYPTLVRPVRKRDIYYNDHVMWIGDRLLVKERRPGDQRASRAYSPHRIMSYGYASFYVTTDGAGCPPLAEYSLDGILLSRYWRVPDGDAHRAPTWSHTPLRNASTGQVGFPRA